MRKIYYKENNSQFNRTTAKDVLNGKVHRIQETLQQILLLVLNTDIYCYG